MAGQSCSLKSSSELCEALSQLNTNADRWTLADDSKLCCALDGVERWMLEQTDAAVGRLQTGLDATSRVAVLTNNLDTRLASFANHQFIESRVYDEPCAVEPASSVINKCGPRHGQDETMDNLREAVSLGFAMLRSHFKRIDMRPQDFDEDDDPTFTPDPVFEPFDPHLCRPLPYLIGSDEWNASSSAGVRDLPVDTTEEKGEVVIGLPPFVQPHSSRAGLEVCSTQPHNALDQRESLESLTAKVAGSADSRRSDHSGLFASADEEGDSDDDLFSCNKPSLQRPAGGHDAAARDGGASPTHSLTPSIRSEASSANIVPSKSAMFADSDSDDDMFADTTVRKADAGTATPREALSRPPQNLPAPSNKAFHGPNAISNISKTTALSANLFDADSDDDDLFAIPKVSAAASSVPAKGGVVKPKSDAPIQAIPTQSAFNSDTFKSRLSSMLVPNPKTAVDSTHAINSTANGQHNAEPLPSIVKSRTRGPGRRAPTRNRTAANERTDNESVEESERSSERTGTSPSEGCTSARDSTDRTILPPVHNEAHSVTSLFSDSDDDIFSTNPKCTNPADQARINGTNPRQINGTSAVDQSRINRPTAAPAPAASAEKRQQDTAQVEVLPKPSSAKLAVRSIFSSSEDDEDIFTKSAPPPKPSSTTVPVTSLVQSSNRLLPSKRGIFDEDSDSDDDLFS